MKRHLLLILLLLSSCGTFTKTSFPEEHRYEIHNGQYEVEWIDADGDGQSELKKMTFADGCVVYYNQETDAWYI